MSSAAVKVVHCYHDPVGARLFIEPVIAALRSAGIESELWSGASGTWNNGKEQRSSKIPWRVVSLDTPVDPLRALCRLTLLWQSLRRIRPAAVHAHLTRGATLPLLAARLTGIKIRIYHNHGMAHVGRHGFERFALRALEHLNFRLATHVVMVSRSNRDAAIADDIPGAREIVVFGYGSIAGVDVHEFQPADEEQARVARLALKLPEHGVVIGFQGRASAHKGLPDLVKAFSLAGLDRQDARLIVAGTSSTQARRLLKFQLPAWLGCLGFVRDMPTFYRACDLIVMPSWYEGLGLAVVEAAACGVPAIASDVPGLRCTMEPGLTGILAPPCDPRALSAALDKLANDSQLRRRMGAAARRFAVERFERSRVLQETVLWMQRVLGEDCLQPGVLSAQRSPQPQNLNWSGSTSATRD